MNTAKRGGKTVHKKITVFTNDPNNQRLYIDFKAKVERLYALSHRRVNLVGNVGETLKKTVTLTPEAKYAFKLKEVTTKSGDNIKYHLKEIEDEKGIRYELSIENTKKEAGPYFDTMYLKTDSTYAPEIQIRVFGNIKNTPVAAKKIEHEKY